MWNFWTINNSSLFLPNWQANAYLSEKDRKRVAMCHDPSTAEKFYVSIPGKFENYNIRKLRMKCLKQAAAKDDDATEGECSESTPETSSDDEQPILDDRPDSESFWAEELENIHRKRKHQSELNLDLALSASSDNELPSFQPPRKKLALEPNSGLDKNVMQLYVYSPSKCSVIVDEPSEPTVNYYTSKMKAIYPLLRRGESSPERIGRDSGSVCRWDSGRLCPWDSGGQFPRDSGGQGPESGRWWSPRLRQMKSSGP